MRPLISRSAKTQGERRSGRPGARLPMYRLNDRRRLLFRLVDPVGRLRVGGCAFFVRRRDGRTRRR